MFRHRKDVAEVHILDSSHERGKDIVFYAKSPLGQRLLHACVVKNKKIAGPVGSPYSPTTVLDQAKQALFAPYLTPTGQEVFVAMVHVLSPYELPPSSLYAIQNALKGQVSFCCGGQLLSEFHEHWPEFLFDTGSLGIYVNQLQGRIDKDDPVSVLFSDHSIFFGQSAALRKTYVKQTFNVTLATFSFNLAPPSIESVHGRITLDEVTDIRSQFRKFAALFAVPHFEDILGEDNVASFTSETLRVAETIRELWSAAYIVYESEVLRREETPKPRKSVGLDIEFKEPILIKVKGIIDKCKKVVEVLRPAISNSNAFVRHIKTEFTTDLLQEKAFLAYCYVQEIANLVPDVIHANGFREVPLKSISLEDLGSVLITAPAGYGKSSFCFHYAKADAAALIDKKSRVLPVYVKLHLLASHSLGSYQDEFYGTTELRTLADPNNTESKSRIDKIRLYLDGMDEISRMGRQREVIALAQKAMQDDSRIEIVVTGRDYIHGPWLKFLPRIRLSELDSNQIDKLVTGLLGDDGEQAKRFYTELEKVPSLKPLMHVPLLATLVVSVYRKRTALPENRVKLYDIFLDLMCGGWDIAKNVVRPTAFGAQTKLSVLTRLAGIAHLNRKRDFTTHEVRIAIKDTTPALENRYRELLDEIVQDGVLIRAGNIYAFKHLSFQEYLAAKDIHGPTGRRQQQALRWYLNGEEWWFQTMAFYVGMLGNPSDTEKWIYSASTSADALSARARIDKLLQAINDAFPGYGSKAPKADKKRSG